MRKVILLLCWTAEDIKSREIYQEVIEEEANSRENMNKKSETLKLIRRLHDV